MDIFPFVSKKKIDGLQSKIAELEERALSGVNIPGELLNRIMDGDKVETISEDTALTLSAFYAGVNILCDSLNIPISVYQRKGDNNREVVTKASPYEFQVHNLLHNSPSTLYTPSQWIQLMEMSRIIYGNGYSLVIRNKLKEPTALQWLHPNKVDVKSDGKSLYYDVKNNAGDIYLRNVKALDMIHVKGLCQDGIMGTGVIAFAAESMGFGKATQVAGNNYFTNGMTNKVVLSHPGRLGKGKGNLQDTFETELKKRSTIVLEEGTKVFTLTIPPEQSQFLESRKFSVTEVARWLNIPEFMLANNDPTYSNIENFALHFVTHNVRPRVRMYEQEFNWKLLTNVKDFYCEYNLNALLRSNTAARSQFYVQMVQNGIMNRNEVRGLENLNNIEGGDEFLTPLNLATDSERDASNDIQDPEE